MDPKTRPKIGPKMDPKMDPDLGAKTKIFPLVLRQKWKIRSQGAESASSKKKTILTSSSDDPKQLMGLIALPIYFHTICSHAFLHVFVRTLTAIVRSTCVRALMSHVLFIRCIRMLFSCTIFTNYFRTRTRF